MSKIVWSNFTLPPINLYSLPYQEIYKHIASIESDKDRRTAINTMNRELTLMKEQLLKMRNS